MARAEYTEESKEEATAVPPSNDSHSNGRTEISEPKESVFQAATSKALRPFIIISSSYLLFTITDGALRMIVLLHAYNKSFSAMEVAVMFTLYELAGVFTNLAAGFMGAKWGIKFTLISGLTLQLVSYGYVVSVWSVERGALYSCRCPHLIIFSS
jgi:MFS family permease